MKHTLLSAFVISSLSFLLVVALFAWRNLREIGSVLQPPPQDAVTLDNSLRKAEKKGWIRLDTPLLSGIVKSPLAVRGEAKGVWFFEGSFPVRLFDGTGQELAVGAAQAKGDWMTEEFVPFEVSLKFEFPKIPFGTLVLEKDNPSGLSEHAQELRVPVIFGEKP